MNLWRCPPRGVRVAEFNSDYMPLLLAIPQIGEKDVQPITVPDPNH